jgi:carbon storage regulator
MLVLTRSVGQEIVIDGNIRVMVLGIHGNKIRLGIAAPPVIRVDRAEIHEDRLASAEHRELEAVHCG